MTITLHPSPRAEQDGIPSMPIAVKAEGMPCRCSKAPTHSSWPQHRFLFERSRDHGNNICKHASPKITNSRRGPSKRSTPVRDLHRQHGCCGSRRPSDTTSRRHEDHSGRLCSVWATPRRRHEEQPDQRHGQLLRQTDLLHPAQSNIWHHIAIIDATKVTSRST